MGKGSLYWDRRFARWPSQKHDPSEGYTLMMPVPGDLPVFLEIALRVCALQQSAHRVETIVVPDAPSEAVERLVDGVRDDWPGEIRVRNLPAPERWITPRLKNPFRNYSLQFFAGVSASNATHVVLHDADLFLMDPGALDAQFERIRTSGAACLGVSAAWDEWFTTHGRAPVATWELLLSTAWARSFPPFKHMARDDVFEGEHHTFDITLLTQALTAPALIERADMDFVHFNHTIAAYRRYQNRTGVFDDRNFRLLLVSLFIELFARDGSSYVVPSLDELSRNLTTAETVRYRVDDETAERYGEFRAGVARIVDGAWASQAEREACESALSKFDDVYRWSPSNV